MTEIFLMRHGQTQWNTAKRFQGSMDIKLDDTGLQQAAKLKQRLSKVDFQAVYTSDLQRCSLTAQMIAKDRVLQVYEMEELREVSFGHWEGQNYDLLKRDLTSGVKAWFDNPSKQIIPGGETVEQVESRLHQVKNHIMANYMNQQVAIVTHGALLRYLLSSWLHLPYNFCWKWDIDNASISVIRWENDIFHLQRLNDCAHL